MKVLAFAASNSRRSINKKLVIHAAEVLSAEVFPEAEVRVIDLNDYELPIYSIDREQADGIPAPAQELFDAIGEVDAVMISFAEHNGLYTAVYKNVFDWMSRINKGVFQNKALLAMSASPGGRGGAGVLKVVEDSVHRFGADLRATFSVPKFGDNFSEDEARLTSAELQSGLREALGRLKDGDGASR